MCGTAAGCRLERDPDIAANRRPPDFGTVAARGISRREPDPWAERTRADPTRGSAGYGETTHRGMLPMLHTVAVASSPGPS